MTTLRPDQVALLVRQAGWPNPTVRGETLHVIMTAVCFAESGGRVEVVNSIGCVGLWQINAPVHRKYDRRLLASDPAYNCRAALEIYNAQGLGAWSAYTNGAWRTHITAARRGVAEAAAVNGNAASPAASSSGSPSAPAVTYGPSQPQVVTAGQGRPLAADAEMWEPISGLRVMGQTQVGDYSRLVIGSPTFEEGIDTIPHLKFTLVDPWGDLVWQHRTILRKGSRVQYKDRNFRIDTQNFTAGSHTTGQLEVTCIDDIAYAMMNLTGPRTASGQGAVQWLAQEMRLAGIPPDQYLLGESVPSQSVISRDVPDQAGSAGAGQAATAWTTGVRLAKELGKRFFISGNRLVFGSAAFAMRWTAPGPIEVVSSAMSNAPGLRMLGIPSLSTVSVSGKGEAQQVVFRVPVNRAKYFRPGVPLLIRYVTFVATDERRPFIVTKVVHSLGVDTDGAEITAMVPIELVPEPPPAPAAANSGSSSSGSSVSGGGADGQVARFVALALQQTGDRYVYGAEARASDPDPRAWDCSELVEWAAGQAGISPRVPDGSGAQRSHCERYGTMISLAAARATKGALLFQPGHVAISLGSGKTIEAMNPSAGVRQGNFDGRGWTGAARIPGAKGY